MSLNVEPIRAGPRPVPLARGQGLLPLVAYQRRLALPEPRMLRAVRSGSEAIPVTQGGRMWDEMAYITDDPAIGLHVAFQTAVAEVPLGGLFRAANNVGEGLAAICAASARFCTGQRIEARLVGDRVQVRHHFPAILRSGRRPASDFALGMLVEAIRLGVGPDWRPSALEIEGRRPSHADELAGLATGPVCFDAAEDAIWFPRSVLLQRLHHQNSILESKPLTSESFIDSLRLAIRSLYRMGELNLPNLAEAAGTSVRSLQRRLAEAELSFSHLVKEALFEEAGRLLRHSHLRVTDIAIELGYTDSANFTRAFRRWSGTAPLAFRNDWHEMTGRGEEPR